MVVTRKGAHLRMSEAVVVAIIAGVFLIVGAAIGALSSLLTTWLTSRGAEKQNERREMLRRRERGEQAAFELLRAMDEAVADIFSYRRESQKRRRSAEEAKKLGWPEDTGYSFGPEQAEIEPIYSRIRTHAVDILDPDVRDIGERLGDILYFYDDVIDLRQVTPSQVASKMQAEARAVLGAYRRGDKPLPPHPDLDDFWEAHQERQEMYEMQYQAAMERQKGERRDADAEAAIDREIAESEEKIEEMLREDAEKGGL